MEPSQKQKSYPGQKNKTLYAQKLRGKKRRREAPRQPKLSSGRIILWASVAVAVVILLALQIL